MFSYINRIQELSEVLIMKKEDRSIHDRLARGIYLRVVLIHWWSTIGGDIYSRATFK